jgi:site-specific DNA-methyltransferase (adenine-specific)
LKDKDIALIPFLIAHEAQQLGYWVRSIIVWEKASFVPEPRVDRPVQAHEYILLIAKSKSYKWHGSAARENGADSNSEGRLLRSVWTMNTSPGKNGHPASFPEQLVERCVRLSTSKGDLVLDPFLGSGTTALSAIQLGRSFIGIDTVKGYLNTAAARLMAQCPSIRIAWREIKHPTLRAQRNSHPA